ncbi:hypothetical protein [Marinomonas ostreistagni]|uniref:DprA winged helix domain-containing protein n=1 Tax=Marinomonas ostreistagni TaxID=359209 RepID=A0ABS0ZGH2_9GAMM|nr:hypothetical protein [Marinomonas ostreistagni]MBJ7552036.1 hypothetical protein [Marinomonas ostreistagni]
MSVIAFKINHSSDDALQQKLLLLLALEEEQTSGALAQKLARSPQEVIKALDYLLYRGLVELRGARYCLK